MRFFRQVNGDGGGFWFVFGGAAVDAVVGIGVGVRVGMVCASMVDIKRARPEGLEGDGPSADVDEAAVAVVAGGGVSRDKPMFHSEFAGNVDVSVA